MTVLTINALMVNVKMELIHILVIVPEPAMKENCVKKVSNDIEIEFPKNTQHHYELILIQHLLM